MGNGVAREVRRQGRRPLQNLNGGWGNNVGYKAESLGNWWTIIPKNKVGNNP